MAMRQKMISRILLFFLLVIFAANYIGISENLYWKYRWFDTPMHLAGGAWAALLFFYIFGERYKRFDLARNFFLTLVLAVGFAALAGVLWEFFEYTIDTYITHLPESAPRPHPNLYLDTLKDLANDLIGGAALAAPMFFWIRRSVKFFPDRPSR